MRKPILKDIFLGAKIARKIGLKDANIDTGGTTEQAGEQTLFFLLENIDKAEDEICELLAGITEKSKEEITNLAIDEIPDLFDELMKLEGMTAFFTRVSKLMKQQS